MTGRHRSPRTKPRRFGGHWRDEIANFFDVRQRRAAKRYWAATRPPVRAQLTPRVELKAVAELPTEEQSEWPKPWRMLAMVVVYAGVLIAAFILAFWTIFVLWWVMWP